MGYPIKYMLPSYGRGVFRQIQPAPAGPVPIPLTISGFGTESSETADIRVQASPIFFNCVQVGIYIIKYVYPYVFYINLLSSK